LTAEIDDDDDDFSTAVGLDNGEDLPDSCQYWHQQAHPDTCAIVCQEFILDELTGQDFSEDQLRQEAIDNGWYTPGGGTPLESMGKVLEAHGIPMTRETGCTLQDLTDKLADGEKVMVALDADEIWYPDKIDEDDALANAGGMPGQDSNHAVQVVGIDNSDPDNPMVILNDSGTLDGQGSRIPVDTFMNAWEDSKFYTVSTALHAA
jgi:hypothetical protein